MEITGERLRYVLEEVIHHHISVVREGEATLGQLHYSAGFLNMVDNYMNRPEMREEVLPSIRHEVMRYVKADAENVRNSPTHASAIKLLCYIGGVVLYAKALADYTSGDSSAAWHDAAIATLSMATGKSFSYLESKLREMATAPPERHDIRGEDLADVLNMADLRLREALRKRS